MGNAHTDTPTEPNQNRTDSHAWDADAELKCDTTTHCKRELWCGDVGMWMSRMLGNWSPQPVFWKVPASTHTSRRTHVGKIKQMFVLLIWPFSCMIWCRWQASIWPQWWTKNVCCFIYFFSSFSSSLHSFLHFFPSFFAWRLFISLFRRSLELSFLISILFRLMRGRKTSSRPLVPHP